jgi:hypothetical protein
VFGYANNRKFYVVMWKGKHYNYKEDSASTYKGGIQGAQIKVKVINLIIYLSSYKLFSLNIKQKSF